MSFLSGVPLLLRFPIPLPFLSCLLGCSFLGGNGSFLYIQCFLSLGDKDSELAPPPAALAASGRSAKAAAGIPAANPLGTRCRSRPFRTLLDLNTCVALIILPLPGTPPTPLRVNALFRVFGGSVGEQLPGEQVQGYCFLRASLDVQSPS